MNLDQVLRGASLFVDANILIYAAERRSIQCRRFLERCASETIFGFSTTIVLAEVCHRRMINEAKEAGIIRGSNPARALGKAPARIAQLSIYAENVRMLLQGEIEFESVHCDDFYVALELQKQHGLLTNDALNLAVAKRLGMTEIATADAHFDHIQGLIVYKPDDLLL